MRKKKRNLLQIFSAHGVEFTGETGSGEEVYGTCPFTGKENKFYVNRKTGLWSSKTAGIGGTIEKFLELRAKEYTTQITKRQLTQLAENRQLPLAAFDEWEIGFYNGRYTIPIRDVTGKVTDIRMYSLRNKTMRSTPSANLGLLGAPGIRTKLNEPIYLCEGEWDTIALAWLTRVLREPGVVVGVPGAGVFKKDWIPWFQGRVVHTLYDEDTAGHEGEKALAKRLSGVARRITYVHWPEEVPEGFDTRDWIVYGSIVRDTPEACFEKLLRRFYNKPKSDTQAKPTTIVQTAPTGPSVRKITIKRWHRWKVPPTIQDVHNIFNKWLFLENTDTIDVMLASILTYLMEGPPLWMFLVGPPGSTKTVYLSSLLDLGICEFVSSLTPHALISGFGVNTAIDPSLLPKLHQRILVVKDFTAILSQSEHDQREIFGILRDAYDGRCSKSFGTGVRSYESRFSVIAACTPQIYTLAEQQQALGERFLKYSVAPNLHHISEEKTIQRAIDNSDKESLMQDELRDVVKNFIERTCRGIPPSELTPTMKTKIGSLAMFGARLRGTVPRDKFHRDEESARPSAEVGTRLGQQLAKLARGLGMVYGKRFAGMHEYHLIKKVTLDTIAQRNEDVLRAMILAMGGTKHLTPMSMRELAAKTGYSFSTIQRVMSDMYALDIIKRQGAGMKSTWTLSDYVFKHITDANLYTKEELQRPKNVGRIRIPRVKRQDGISPPHPRTIRKLPTNQKPVQISMKGSKITIANPAKKPT